MVGLKQVEIRNAYHVNRFGTLSIIFVGISPIEKTTMKNAVSPFQKKDKIL